MKNWDVVCNVYGDRLLRNGAKCRVYIGPHGAKPSIVLVGLSKGGRKIKKWVRLRRCNNFRPQYYEKYEFGFETKEEAQEQASKIGLWAARERGEK